MGQKPWTLTHTHTHIEMIASKAGAATYKPLVEGDEGDEGAERFVAVYLRQWGAHLLSEVTTGDGGGSRRRRVATGGGV